MLNSGNVVFETSRPGTNKISSALEGAIQNTFGFSASVIVVTAADLNDVVEANPLRRVATDPSKHLVAFVSRASVLDSAKPLLAASWEPDAIALGTKAAYLWCANGIIGSRLMQAFDRAARGAATTRNWATVLKLRAIANGGENAAGEAAR